MSRIKFRLVKFERSVAFQIIEMSESERYNGMNGKNYYAKNGVVISSITKPAINMEPVAKVFLRGADSHFDFYVSTAQFKNNTARDTFYDKVLEALKEWAEYGFDDKPTKTKSDFATETYEF